MSVLSPIATIARIIKNLLKVLNGTKTDELTPILSASVVIIDAAIKYKINVGKDFDKETLFPLSLFLLVW